MAPANRSREPSSRSSGKMYYPKLDIHHTDRCFIAQTRINYYYIFQPSTKDPSEIRTVGDHRVHSLFAHVKYVFIKIYRV